MGDLKALTRRQFEEIFGKGNLDVADELVGDDYVGYDSAQPEPTRGREALKQAAAGYRAAFSDLTCTVDEQVAEGDTVVSHWTAAGTHDGDLFGIPPTGKHATVTGITISRVSDGKIVEERTVWDTYGLMVQLGVIPAPAAA